LKHRIGTSAADLDRAIADFEKSIELSQDPIDDLLCALNDPDLTLVKQMKRFKDLLKRFDVNPPEAPTV
jgi:CBS-domain-containing membrane protein